MAGFVVSSNASLSVLNPPFGFDSITALPDHNVQFAFTGPLGNYVIETSTNLTFWQVLTSVSNATGTVQFTDLTATNQPASFYRAKLIP
jgi:hypothetical protein